LTEVNKGGRPEHERTEALAKRVMVRAAAQWKVSLIAEDVGVSEPTLRKHYAEELSKGWTMLQGYLLDLLMEQAAKGKTAAIRMVNEGTLQTAGVRPKATKAKREEQPREVKAAALGKKESRALGAAQAISGDSDLRQN